MATKVRIPNKAGWALNEALNEHDPEIAELMGMLLDQIQREREAAANRFDKSALLRLADMTATVAMLQRHISRLATIHWLARNNEYDRQEQGI